MSPADEQLLAIFDGWEWRDSLYECELKQPHPDMDAEGAPVTTTGPPCKESTPNIPNEDIQQACTYGGVGTCIRTILIAHGFPPERGSEVIAYFCEGPGRVPLGCDPGYALDDTALEFLLIDVPISILTGGIAGAIRGGAAITGGSLVSKGASGAVERLVIVDTNMVLDRPAVEALLAAGEKPVITQATKAELNNLVAQGRISMPKWAAELEVIDDVMNVNLRINIRAGISSTKGLAGDGMIGATAAERGLPIITRDKNFAKFLEYMGVEVRKP